MSIIIIPPLAPIQNSIYSTKQCGVSLTQAPKKYVKNVHTDYSPQFVKSVANEINTKIAYDNLVLLQKESYENSGFTPIYSGAQDMSYNSIGKIHRETNKDVQQPKSRINSIDTSPPPSPPAPIPYERIEGLNSFLKGKGKALFEIPFKHPSIKTTNIIHHHNHNNHHNHYLTQNQITNNEINNTEINNNEINNNEINNNEINNTSNLLNQQYNSYKTMNQQYNRYNNTNNLLNINANSSRRSAIDLSHRPHLENSLKRKQIESGRRF